MRLRTWRQHLALRCAATLCTIAAALFSGVTTPLAATTLNVAASLPMVGEWVRAVGGEAVQVHVVAPAGADPHTFEPSVRNVQAVNRAQALFVIGLGLEPWAERLARAQPQLNLVPLAPKAGLRALDHHHGHATSGHTPTHASDHVLAHTSDHGHVHQHATTDGHAHCTHGEYDPHVWLDPLMVSEMTAEIARVLSTLAPEKAEAFERNAAAYRARLNALHTEIIATLSTVPPARRKLVSNHDNLHYFARRYDFTVIATLFDAQGSAGGQPSARKVRAIVSEIHRHGVRALFADASTDPSLLQAVAREAQLPPPGVFYSIPAGAGSPAPDYIQMMRVNAAQIAQALAAPAEAAPATAE